MPPARPPPEARDRLTHVLCVLPYIAAQLPMDTHMALAPVFGPLPSWLLSWQMLALSFSFGFLLQSVWKSRTLATRYLFIADAWLPVIQLHLDGFSSKLGPRMGPILLGFLSCHTLIALSAYAMAQVFDIGGWESSLGRTYDRMVLMAVALITILFAPELVSYALEGFPLPFLFPLQGRIQLVLVRTLSFMGVALSYPRMTYPKILLLAAPAVLYTLYFNPHYSVDTVNTALNPFNWTLVDRQTSTTGYISVLENAKEQYRILRCDHSILGGEWLATEQRKTKEGWKVDESIYAVFEMLEAVRLIELEPVVPDHRAQALVVGLGIGTAPKAFITHGINTTIVELDPVVYRYASEYFGLPTNRTAIIQDAVSWVEQTAVAKSHTYDYIIHDVFTGGAEPLALFNNVFLSNLRALLKPNGVIAINYAGDLSLPLTRLVLSTIGEVFYRQCKIYRDNPPEANADNTRTSETPDFLNMVVFCRNTAGPIRFRRPTDADFLGSQSRKHFMLPKAEHEIPFPVQDHVLSSTLRAPQVLTPGGQKAWNSQQLESAVRHWRIMRKVVPNEVWELW